MTVETIKNKEAETLLLLSAKDDFLITGGPYSSQVNVTFRKPMKFEKEVVLTEVTTSVAIDGLVNLRLELLDGKVYVRSDKRDSGGFSSDNSIKLCVESERIGRALIKELVLYKQPENERSKIHVKNVTARHGINKNLPDYQELLQVYTPSIAILCGIALTLSACIWFLFL